MNKATHIYFEQSPNPNSLKFVMNYLIVPEGRSYDFPDPESAENAPLAKALFGFDYVRRVFLMNNFVTITKDASVDWMEIREELRTFIREYLETDKPVVNLGEVDLDNEEEVVEESEIDLKIRMLLEEYVRPAVEQDGGAIEYHSFKDGTVRVLLQGSCSGCPSSMLTLKAGIENLLKSMIPEVKTVEAEGI
ncbi:MAG: NifU family protein [Cyclobacteriaceae bacterium]|nr:NifU family protein [Cyclobacteriaceae bacterium]